MATPDTVRRQSPAAEAWGLIHELFATYGKRRFHAVATEFELSPPQVMALRALDPSKPLPMSSLAGALHCDNSNVTGIVDRLEDRGLVERHSGEHDRRVKMLVVTPKGAELRAQLSAALEHPPEPLAKLSPEDQRTLRDIMRRALRP
ncbi:MAG: MarR family transcriptional regulator [Solirubrobacterales bacterium]|nr:MarR family transcriptional regulator [Solirubrobacterales bacterium]